MIKYKGIEFETVDQLIEYQEKMEGASKKAPRLRRKDKDELLEKIEDLLRQHQPAPPISFPPNITLPEPGSPMPSPSPWTPWNPPYEITCTDGTPQNLSDLARSWGYEPSAVVNNTAGLVMPVETDENLEENQFYFRNAQ